MGGDVADSVPEGVLDHPGPATNVLVHAPTADGAPGWCSGASAGTFGEPGPDVVASVLGDLQAKGLRQDDSQRRSSGVQ